MLSKSKGMPITPTGGAGGVPGSTGLSLLVHDAMIIASINIEPTAVNILFRIYCLRVMINFSFSAIAKHHDLNLDQECSFVNSRNFRVMQADIAGVEDSSVVRLLTFRGDVSYERWHRHMWTCDAHRNLPTKLKLYEYG